MKLNRKFLNELQRLCRDALRAGGERKGPISFEWDMTGNTRCERPHITELRAKPSSESVTDKFVVVGRGTPAPLYINLHTPCRKCSACLRHRVSLWRMRALSEGRAASRTWLGTLTLSPEAQFNALTRARAQYRDKGDFDVLPPEQQLRLRDRQIAPDIQRYLKRVRAQSAAPLRYLCVCEPHQSGAPHYHVLVHEGHPDHPIRHKLLKEQWKLGFSDFKLVQDPRQISYVCKYVAKSMGARVRASIEYGTPPVVVTPDNVNVRGVSC